MDISLIATGIHIVAKEHGWWDEERPIPELLCLVHSEVSEALEAYRNAKTINEELADIVIRVFDMAEHLGINIEDEIIMKHCKNRSRPHRHGGKKC